MRYAKVKGLKVGIHPMPYGRFRAIGRLPCKQKTWLGDHDTYELALNALLLFEEDRAQNKIMKRGHPRIYYPGPNRRRDGRWVAIGRNPRGRRKILGIFDNRELAELACELYEEKKSHDHHRRNHP